MAAHSAAPDAGAAAQEAEGRSSILWLFVGLMVTMLMASMNQTSLSTALPTIVGDLGGVEQMSWVITGYILASTIMMPVYGRISDQLGRKPVLLTAIVLFMVGSVLGGLAGNIWWLVFARVVQGIGGGGLIILAQAAIADVVPARERGKYMGIMGAVFAVSSVGGPLLGGWITEGPGWRWVFWINLPLGVLSILATMAFLHLPKRPKSDAKTDYLGMTILAAATTAVVLVCTWGGHTYGWGSPQIIGLIVAAVLLAGAFVLCERRAEQPVIPLALFADRNFTVTTGAALLIGVAMFGAVGYFPTYLQMVTGVNATEAGLLMAPMMGALLVASTISGAIVSRTGRYKAFPLAGALIMGVGLWLMASLTITSATWWMCTVLAIFGVGIGFSMQILTLIVQNSFPNAIVGTATAATNYFRQVGASVGSAIVGSMFIARLHDLLAQRLPHLGKGGSGGAGNSLTPEKVSNLPDAIRIPVIESYNEALLPIFMYMVPLAIVTFLLLLFVKEKPLATVVEDEILAESLAEGQLIEMVDEEG
jgi:EmrB/QacA subfamily drug resistance transporter